MLIEALDQAYDKIRRLEAQKNKREEEDADEDSVDKLKIIEKEEEEDDVNECEEEACQHPWAGGSKTGPAKSLLVQHQMAVM